MSDVIAPLLHTVREYCRKNVRALDIDKAAQIPPKVLTELAELGLFGLTLPAAYGGSQLSALDATEVVAALAEFDRSIATTVGLHLGLGTRGLVAFGNPRQHERWLPSLSAGKAIAAFSTTEPGAGSDLSQLSSVAVPSADGRLTLNGQKIFVTNGGLCSLLTVTTVTLGMGGVERGMSLLLFDPHVPGVHRQPEEHKLGLRGSSTTGFIFEDVSLEPDALLGEPGAASQYLPHILSWGRLLLSAGCVGTSRTALQATLEHVHRRRQFRKPLVQHEVVQQQLSYASALAFAMRSLVRDAAALENDYALLARLTTSAKVFCSEATGFITDLAIQLHGGSGYIEDVGVALLMRDARVTRIFEGANDVLLTHVGVSELTQPEASASIAGCEEVDEAIRERRAELCGDARVPGIQLLNRKLEQHQLGRAVVWKHAARAASRHAKSSLERAAAKVICDRALEVARAQPPPPLATAVLSAALMEGVLP